MIKKILTSAIFIFLSVYLLYKNMSIAMVSALISVSVTYIRKRKEIAAKDNEVLFLNYLNCLLPLLSVQRPLANTLSKAVDDYITIYGEDKFILSLGRALKDTRISKDLSSALNSAAQRLMIDDLRLFSDIAIICERSGGNTAESIRRCIEIIRDKINIRLEIDMLLAQKTLEQKIISMMPIIILGIFSLSSENYLSVLYETAEGKIIMTVAGLLFLSQWYLGRKISDIKV